MITPPFKANIDSVRIKDSATSCTAFDFKGLGYTNTSSIVSWQWFLNTERRNNSEIEFHFTSEIHK